MTQLLTIDEVAEYLQIPVATLYQWRHKGMGPKALKLGRHLRYRPDEVEDWRCRRRAPRTPAGAGARDRLRTVSERAVTFDRLLTMSEVAAFLQKVAAPADELVGLVSHAVRSDAVVLGEPAAAGTLPKGQVIRVTRRLDLVGAPVRPAAPGNPQ